MEPYSYWFRLEEMDMADSLFFKDLAQNPDQQPGQRSRIRKSYCRIELFTSVNGSNPFQDRIILARLSTEEDFLISTEGEHFFWN
jgi:hypothetical protein